MLLLKSMHTILLSLTNLVCVNVCCRDTVITFHCSYSVSGWNIAISIHCG